MTKIPKRKVVVAVSGGFDPIHIGHIELFQAAKKLGDELVVILNNDNWLKQKKQHIFMDQSERRAILEALKPVDRVVLPKHRPDTKDISVCQALKDLPQQELTELALAGDRAAAYMLLRRMEESSPKLTQEFRRADENKETLGTSPTKKSHRFGREISLDEARKKITSG
ncbi:MAG: adenylyltransferase/cytidyltransferase family protein, partial [Patescibacteria group bacterium]